MAVRDQVMSGTERAPEPTMEEILASIRRIISDDETNAARARPASARQHDEDTVEVEGEADDAIINDIARVLSESAPKVEDEEDILDLTARKRMWNTPCECVLHQHALLDESLPDGDWYG